MFFAPYVSAPLLVAVRKENESGCGVLMFSNWIYMLYCCMEEHHPRIKRTVFFDNESSSLSCRNLGSSEPKLRCLVVHPLLGLRTDSAGGIRLGETINWNYSSNRALVNMLSFSDNI
jgi:hypothetical protein